MQQQSHVHLYQLAVIAAFDAAAVSVTVIQLNLQRLN